MLLNNTSCYDSSVVLWASRLRGMGSSPCHAFQVLKIHLTVQRNKIFIGNLRDQRCARRFLSKPLGDPLQVLFPLERKNQGSTKSGEHNPVTETAVNHLGHSQSNCSSNYLNHVNAVCYEKEHSVGSKQCAGKLTSFITENQYRSKSYRKCF